jgi:hypothetical protein
MAAPGELAPDQGSPPSGLPRYRLLSGPDDDAFCHRVGAALELGYVLHGSPACTFDGNRVVVVQALIWPSPVERSTA